MIRAWLLCVAQATLPRTVETKTHDLPIAALGTELVSRSRESKTRSAAKRNKDTAKVAKARAAAARWRERSPDYSKQWHRKRKAQSF